MSGLVLFWAKKNKGADKLSNIASRYSSATQSSNLKDDEHHHQTEILAAVALSSALGSLLFRVKYANDATSYSALLEKWREIVKMKAVFRNWPTDKSTREIARLSLDYWLNDICTVCGGHGNELVKDVPNVRQDAPCRACNGTAKRPIEANHKVLQYVTDMVEAIEEMTRYAGDRAVKKLAKQMDFL